MYIQSNRRYCQLSTIPCGSWADGRSHSWSPLAHGMHRSGPRLYRQVARYSRLSPCAISGCFPERPTPGHVSHHSSHSWDDAHAYPSAALLCVEGEDDHPEAGDREAQRRQYHSVNITIATSSQRRNNEWDDTYAAHHGAHSRPQALPSKHTRSK